MPSRCLTTTSPVVTRLLIRSPRSTWFCSRKVRSWVGGAAAVVDEAAQVGVGAGQRAAEQPELRGEVPDRADSESIWPCRTVLLSLIRAVVTSKLSLAVVDERVAAVDDPLEVLAGAAEGGAELVDGGLQVVLVDRLDGRRRGRSSSVSVAIGSPGVGLVDLRVVVRGTGRRRAAAGARRTAHRRRTGCRPRRGCRRGCRRSRCRCRGTTSTPVVGELRACSTWPTPDAAVGDLAAGEDAAGVGEVRDRPCSCRRRTAGRAGRSGRPTKLHAEQGDQRRRSSAGSWCGG